jgi:hypothetical protein
VPGRGQEEVDARVAVVRVRLLADLREPDGLAVALDREDERVLPGSGQLDEVLLAEAQPPAGDLGLSRDLREAGTSAVSSGRSVTRSPRRRPTATRV